MAAPQPVIQTAPPIVEVQNIFFKAFQTVNYFSEEEADAIENDVAFRHFNRSLECSNKYGCLLLSFNNAFYLLEAKDVLTSQKGRSFEDLKKLQITNDALPVAPNVIALSNGEDYLAVDTVRGDSGWLIVFRLADFINQAGSCRPFCEIRCSSSPAIRVSGVGWNPGENMNNMIAINTDEGALFLAKINGPGSVELNKLPEMNIRSLCWSPKGKQLVVGRSNGSISQLKLDLTLAKQIPPPEAGSVPISILWTQTTQFLVVFQKGSGIDFMQLDVAKGAPPTYTNSGDIFVSEAVPQKCSSFFVPIVQWNIVVTMTNTSNEIAVLVKESRNQNEVWIQGEIAEGRMPLILLDNYTRGVTVFYGSESGVVFSETESYSAMPVLFLLSHRGALQAYSVVNNKPEEPSLTIKTSMALPDSIFSTSRAVAKQPPPPQYQSPQTVQTAPAASPAPIQFQPQATIKQEPKQSGLPTATLSFGGPGQMPSFQSQPTSLSTSLFSQQSTLFKPNTQPAFSTPPPQQPQFQSQQQSSFLPQGKSQTQSPKLFSAQQNQPTVPKLGSGDSAKQQQQQSDLRQLAGPSILSTSLDMAGLEKAVEEKRREMTTQLQKGAALKGLEDDNQCAFVISEVRTFEQKMAEFKQKTQNSRAVLNQLLQVASHTLEKPILSTLNAVEDFNSDMVSTTSAQKEEVEVLKERILNHFSQLEYAKSLVERSRDPRYLEHLRSRPLDPTSQQKFEEIGKLHHYIQNQVSECRRYFYEQNRKRDMTLDRAPSTQLIYMTLSNHSKIIRRLKMELDNIKERLGLGKHTTAFDEAEFLAVCEASYSGTKKTSTLPKQNEDQDEITLSDLTAGISKVKLNRDSSRPDKKPITFSNRKLLILSKRMSETSVVKVKADETTWTKTPRKSTRPKPLAYPTTEKFVTGRVETSSVKPDAPTPPSFGSTFVINSDSGTPFNTGNNGTKAPPKPTGTAKSGSLFGNIGNTASPSNQSPINFQGKPADSSTTASPKPTFSVNPSAKASAPLSNPSFGNMLGKGFNMGSSSPSAQNPTLTELLATPPSVSPFGGTGSGLASKAPGTPPTVTSASTGLPGLNMSFRSPAGFTLNEKSIFGPGAFSAAFQQEQPSSASPDNTVKEKPPLLPSFGATSSSATTADSSSLSFTSPSTGNTGIIGSRPAQSKTTSAEMPSKGLSYNSGYGTGSAVTGGAESYNIRSSLPLSFSISTSTIAASMGRSGTTSTGSPGQTQSLMSSSSVTSPFAGFGTALNLSSSDAGSKSSNIAATSATPATGSFSTPALSFGSPASGGGTSSVFGQTKTAAESPATPSVTATASMSTPTSSLSSATVTPRAPETSVTSTIGTSTPSSSATTTGSTAPALATGGATATFGVKPTPQTTTPAVSSITTGLFSSSFTSPSTTQSIFSSAGTTTITPPVATGIGAGILGNAPTATTITTTTTASSGLTNLFGAAPSTTTTSIFSNPSAPAGVGAGLFTLPSSTSIAPVGAAPPVTTSAGPFGSPSPGFFSQTAAPATGAAASGAAGFMSSLSLSGADPANKTAVPGSAAPPAGLFSSSAFGSAAPSPSAGSIFGGAGNTFGSTATATPQTSATSLFGNPTTAAATTIFGGAPAFGAASPFGSSFGGASSPPAFGGGSAGVFGSAAPTTGTTQTPGFGQLAQQTSTASPFGSSVFGGGAQQQTSLFASPQKPAAGPFSSPFGSAAPTTAPSIFGGGASSFGGNTVGAGGAFTSGGQVGGVAQQGFGGFAQSKPAAATGSVFGSPPAAAPVFGGGATFGSTSPFGSSFSTPAASTFGSPAGGSVFGGGAATQTNTGFGTLAQQGTATPGFGTGGGFGAAVQPQSPSLFGSPPAQQQQQQKPGFGGNAFSSWR